MPAKKTVDLATPTVSLLTPKDAYEEVGRNYRFFLNWRYGIVAGYLAVLAGLVNVFLSIATAGNSHYWLGFIFGVVFTVFFWSIERRNRELYRDCIDCASALEREFLLNNGTGVDGIYAKFNKDGELVKGRPSHSKTLDAFFSFFLVICLMLSAIFFPYWGS